MPSLHIKSKDFLLKSASKSIMSQYIYNCKSHLSIQYISTKKLYLFFEAKSCPNMPSLSINRKDFFVKTLANVFITVNPIFQFNIYLPKNCIYYWSKIMSKYPYTYPIRQFNLNLHHKIEFSEWSEIISKNTILILKKYRFPCKKKRYEMYL